MELVESTNGLVAFLAYLGTASLITLLYIVVYMWVTPHPEISLIRENNLAAAIAFCGQLNRFLSSTCKHHCRLGQPDRCCDMGRDCAAGADLNLFLCEVTHAQYFKTDRKR